MRSERPPIKRCAIYTRKSSEEGLEQEFNSLHAQRESCEAYIKSQAGEGWRVHPTAYDDGGISGGTMDRPGLNTLLADIEAGLIDTIVVYKVDRLTRSLSDFAKIIEVFDRKGVSFVAVTQQFNTTSSMGRLTLNILLSFAQFEREVTGERIRDKFAASKRKGIWMGGLPPLGYDAHDRKLIVNEPEAEQVRTIFRCYVELGIVSALKLELDARGIRSKPRFTAAGQPTGDLPISHGHLNNILRNRVYIGEIKHKGAHYPGLHDAIVPLDLWQEVQDKLDANRQGKRRKSVERPVNPLSGKLVEQGGERLVASHAQKEQRKYRYYVSTFLIRKAKDEIRRGWRIPASALETLVLASLETFLTETALLTEAWRRAGQPLDKLQPFIAAVQHRSCNQDPGSRYDLIDHVTLAATGITLHLDLARLVPGMPVLVHEVPITIARRGIEMRLVHEKHDARPAAVDPTLVRAVARGHRWFAQMLADGIGAEELARTEGVSARYILRLARLAFLSPAIVRTIVEGYQPQWLDAETLANRISIPLAWADQTSALTASKPT
jgi:DNA invertase Pin-like site-specific DNA recombinase